MTIKALIPIWKKECDK